MPQPRYVQVDIEATPYYHVISRCVRRAFLCGYDRCTQKTFDHRKAWLLERVAVLSEVFAIRVFAYAVLSNHFHLVVRIDAERAREWSDDEVVERYGELFPRTVEPWSSLSERKRAQLVALWRARLADLSWFMRCLNESIARRANKEDGCTGRFWEGRFRSQALLDAAALLTCMSYVDLNPIRAGMAGSLEESDFTSIQQRLDERDGASGEGKRIATIESRRPEVAAFAHEGQPDTDLDVPIRLDEYVALLTATGAALRSGASLSDESVRLLERIGIQSEHWVETVRHYRDRFFAMVGHVHRMAIYCARVDRGRAKGSAWASTVFRSAA